MVPFGSSGTRCFVQLAALDEVHQTASAKRHRQSILVLCRRISSGVIGLNDIDEPCENIITISAAVVVKIRRRANRRKTFVIRCLIGQSRTTIDRKSTRLNSSHGYISYAVFCLKKKK